MLVKMSSHQERSECELACVEVFHFFQAGSHFVIDVNYFPSFKGIPGVHSALCNLLRRKLQIHKSTVAQTDNGVCLSIP